MIVTCISQDSFMGVSVCVCVILRVLMRKGSANTFSHSVMDFPFGRIFTKI